MADTRIDKLIVKNLGKTVDGVYEFDLVELVNVGQPGSLNGNEAHLLKLKSGVRGAELMDAVIAADLDVFFALAAIILQRNGKKIEVDALWDHAWGDQLGWELDEQEEARDGLPPQRQPPLSEENVEPSPSGGESSERISGHLESVPSPTGLPGSETSVISPLEISAS